MPAWKRRARKWRKATRRRCNGRFQKAKGAAPRGGQHFWKWERAGLWIRGRNASGKCSPIGRRGLFEEGEPSRRRGRARFEKGRRFGIRIRERFEKGKRSGTRMAACFEEGERAHGVEMAERERQNGKKAGGTSRDEGKSRQTSAGQPPPCDIDRILCRFSSADSRGRRQSRTSIGLQPFDMLVFCPEGNASRPPHGPSKARPVSPPEGARFAISARTANGRTVRCAS